MDKMQLEFGELKNKTGVQIETQSARETERQGQTKTTQQPISSYIRSLFSSSLQHSSCFATAVAEQLAGMTSRNVNPPAFMSTAGPGPTFTPLQGRHSWVVDPMAKYMPKVTESCVAAPTGTAAAEELAKAAKYKEVRLLAGFDEEARDRMRALAELSVRAAPRSSAGFQAWTNLLVSRSAEEDAKADHREKETAVAAASSAAVKIEESERHPPPEKREISVSISDECSSSSDPESSSDSCKTRETAVAGTPSQDNPATKEEADAHNVQSQGQSAGGKYRSERRPQRDEACRSPGRRSYPTARGRGRGRMRQGRSRSRGRDHPSKRGSRGRSPSRGRRSPQHVRLRSPGCRRERDTRSKSIRVQGKTCSYLVRGRSPSPSDVHEEARALWLGFQQGLIRRTARSSTEAFEDLTPAPPAPLPCSVVAANFMVANWIIGKDCDEFELSEKLRQAPFDVVVLVLTTAVAGGDNILEWLTRLAENSHDDEHSCLAVLEEKIVRNLHPSVFVALHRAKVEGCEYKTCAFRSGGVSNQVHFGTLRLMMDTTRQSLPSIKLGILDARGPVSTKEVDTLAKWVVADQLAILTGFFPDDPAVVESLAVRAGAIYFRPLAQGAAWWDTWESRWVGMMARNYFLFFGYYKRVAEAYPYASIKVDWELGWDVWRDMVEPNRWPGWEHNDAGSVGVPRLGVIKTKQADLGRWAQNCLQTCVWIGTAIQGSGAQQRYWDRPNRSCGQASKGEGKEKSKSKGQHTKKGRGKGYKYS